MKKLPIFVLFAALALPLAAPAQQGAGLSSMGTDFYLTELQPSFRCPSTNRGSYILISSPSNQCRVSIDYFDGANGQEIGGKTFILSARQSVEYALDPHSMNPVYPNGETPVYASCHISSSIPIGVSYYSQGSNAGALTLILPTAVLGKSYVIASLPANPAMGAVATYSCTVDSSSSEFAIVAVRDSTLVTITPNGRTRTGRIGVSSGVGSSGSKHPFQTLLQRGEVYWVKSTLNDPSNDMSGSTVTASWPIAVFAGNEDAIVNFNTAIPLNEDQRNMVMQEMVPILYWRDSDYLSIPFVDPPSLSSTSDARGDEFKLFALNSSGTSVNCTTDQGSDQFTLNPFQLQYNSEENVTSAMNTSAQSHGPIMVEQYDYRADGTGAPSTSPTTMNVVPLKNFATKFSFMVPPTTNLKNQYLNVIFRQDQYGKIKVWRNDSEFSLQNLARNSSRFSIPGHPELEGLQFQISPDSYFFSGDSAFMVYQYGMYASTDLGDYFSEYAAPTGETFGFESTDTPTVLIDTLCAIWNVSMHDTAGIASIELLNDPDGIYLHRTGADSGYVSFNAIPNPQNFGMEPADPALNFEILVQDPKANATAWLLITNYAGNSRLVRLYYTAPNFSFLSTQQPSSNTAKFFKSQIGVDTCTEFVLKTLAPFGGKSFNVTGYNLRKDDSTFSVTSTIPSLPFQLASGDSIIFNVCFDPGDTNIHSDSLVVEMDCLMPEAAVIGQAQVGIIWAGDYDFGKVPVGDTVCHDIYIQNRGSAPFIITNQSFLSNSTDFSIEDTIPIIIQPNRLIDLNFCFTPHSTGSVSALLKWVTNIPEPFTHSIKDTTLLLGYGVQPLSVTVESTPFDGLRVIPSGDQLQIILPLIFGNGAHLLIFDELGRELRNVEMKSQTESLDVSDLSSGTYYLRASKGNNFQTANFIITH